jgi:murein DD-endopeptidase MepM/ murein hydrolase activator NlpD
LHFEIDIAVPLGTPVYAAQKGKVVFAGTATGYGTAVYVDHP